MFDAARITDQFDVTTPGFAGRYKYAYTFANHHRHRAWVWVRSPPDGTAPHLTLWDSDVNRNGRVISCHLSYTYNQLPGREVHVYFSVDAASGMLTFTKIDAYRCGSDAVAATRAANAMIVGLRVLAYDLLSGAFPP